MSRFLLPFLFIFFFILESLFVELLPISLLQNGQILVPHFLLVLLLMLTLYGNRKEGIIYSFCFGLLFDVVYTGIIGIYFFMYPLMSYVVSKIMKVLQTNIIIVAIVTMFAVVLLEVGVYELYYIIQVTNMDFVTFIQMRLVPTLALNLIFLIITIYPLKRLFEKYALLTKKD